MKFQLHGKKVKQTATSSKVLDHLVITVHSTFNRPTMIVKGLREIKNTEPTDPKRNRVGVDGVASAKKKVDAKFEQETVDMKFSQGRTSYEKDEGKFNKDWEKT